MLPIQRAQWQARAKRAALANCPVVVADSDDEINADQSDVEMQPVRTVDFMEVYSPPRVCLDIVTGYDFLTMEDRARCLRLIEQERPKFLMVRPPCTTYSPLQALFNLHKMTEEEKARRFLEAAFC